MIKSLFRTASFESSVEKVVSGLIDAKEAGISIRVGTWMRDSPARVVGGLEVEGAGRKAGGGGREGGAGTLKGRIRRFCGSVNLMIAGPPLSSLT